VTLPIKGKKVTLPIVEEGLDEGYSCWFYRPRLNQNVLVQAASRSAELTTKPDNHIKDTLKIVKKQSQKLNCT